MLNSVSYSLSGLRAALMSIELLTAIIYKVYRKPSIPAMTLPPAAARLFAWLNFNTMELVMMRMSALAIIVA